MIIILTHMLWSQTPSIDILIGRDKRPQFTGIDVTRNIAAYKLSKKFSGKNKFRFFCDKINDANVTIELSSVAPIYVGKDPYDGEIYLLLDDNKCLIVQRTNLENYLASVVAKEMHPSWPIEALKAQSVVARSYAISKIRENRKAKYHIENSEKHQVGGSLLAKTKSTQEAVNSTFGEALVDKNDKVVPAFYHAKCGERSFLPEEVWGEEVEGYASVPCLYDEEHSKEIWAHKLTLNDFTIFLNQMCEEDKIKCNGKIKRIDIASDKMSNSKLRIHSDAGIIYLKKSLVRKFYGMKKIVSNSFKLNLDNNSIFIEGKGRGHGVGMGQIGALTMARLGLNYIQILSYYYPNFKVKKVYP